MTKTVNAIFDEPTVLRLSEPAGFPLHVPVEVTIHEIGEGVASTFLQLDKTVGETLPADFSERWKDYLAADAAERSR
ncbi:MAG TPA: hypothetical protein VNU46_04960 [Gemmatimonadaceae bacterium]|jgi:hypothetical protein|nr:hypothetical protein [Gemmatimonadaceae bacterium]